MARAAAHPGETRRRGPTLRARVTLWMIGISLVIFLVLSTVFFLFQRSQLDRSFTTRIEFRAEIIARELGALGPAVTDAALAAIAARELRFPRPELYAVSIVSAAGDPIASTASPPFGLEAFGGALPAPGVQQVVRRSLSAPPFGPGPVVEAGRAGGEGVVCRVLARRLGSDAGSDVLVLAMTDNGFEENSRTARSVFLFALPASIIACAVSAWLVSGIALSPLRQLDQLAEIVSPERLEQDLAVHLPMQSVELENFRNELEESRRRLRLALQAQDRFISNVSHELKTPVAVLLAEAQTLPLHTLPEDGRQFVVSVVEEMRRLGRMVESFLTLTKLRGGKGLSSFATHDVNDIVMDAVSNCTRMARQYRVGLEPALLESEQPFLITGEGEMLRVMLDNLVRNAVRFSPERGRIDVGVEADDARCAILIRDHGPGVPEELLDKIFNRFVQAEGEELRGRGHGLGLSIAQGIAEIHGGEITVRNHPEGGCEFAVRLPRAADGEPRTQPSEPRP